MADAGKGHDNARDRGERRGGDRRLEQVAFEGQDRREADRRSGRDRREKARTRLTP
ncbi:MAG: hypothetical protein ACTHK5_07435 [Tsuneonella sp.]